MFRARRIAAVSCCVAILTASVFAQDLSTTTVKRSPQDVLSAVPGNAWAVAIVPNLNQFDRKITTLMQQLQVPIPFAPLAMTKMSLGFQNGFDDDGGLAVVMMPMADGASPGKSVLILLPTTDYDALVTPLGPELVEGTISKIYFMDEEAYVSPFGRFAAVAPSQELLTKAINARTSLRDVLATDRLARIEKDELTVWANFTEFSKSNLYKGFAAMAQMAGGDMSMVEQFDTGSISLRIGESGINFGMHVDAQAGTALAKAIATAGSTDETLLIGLPAEPFVFAGGQMSSETGAQQSAKMMDEMFEKMADKAGEQKELVNSMRAMLIGIIRNMRHVSFSVAAIDGGADGMIGVTLVLTTEGQSKAVRDTAVKAVSILKKVMDDDAQAAEYSKLVEYKVAAEKIDGIDVDHFKVTLPSEELGEEFHNAMKVIVGQEGILIRLATLDDRHTLVVFGGGGERFKKAAAAAKSDEKGLANNPGIKHVAANLPSRKNSEFYFALDHLARLAINIGTAVGESMPIKASQIPDINAPIAVVSTPVGKTGSQTEIYIPMKLLQSAKDIAMAQMMAQQQRPPHPVDPPPPPS